MQAVICVEAEEVEDMTLGKIYPVYYIYETPRYKSDDGTEYEVEFDLCVRAVKFSDYINILNNGKD